MAAKPFFIVIKNVKDSLRCLSQLLALIIKSSNFAAVVFYVVSLLLPNITREHCLDGNCFSQYKIEKYIYFNQCRFRFSAK